MKLRALCKSKIHHAYVTQADVEYIGSIAIDQDLLAQSDIVPGEKVHVWNVTNGERFETYALPAPAGSGSVIVNGAAAHRVSVGDKIIIAAFVLTDEPVMPRMILVDRHNQYVADLQDNRMPDLPLSKVMSPAAE